MREGKQNKNDPVMVIMTCLLELAVGCPRLNIFSCDICRVFVGEISVWFGGLSKALSSPVSVGSIQSPEVPKITQGRKRRNPCPITYFHSLRRWSCLEAEQWVGVGLVPWKCLWSNHPEWCDFPAGLKWGPMCGYGSGVALEGWSQTYGWVRLKLSQDLFLHLHHGCGNVMERVWLPLRIFPNGHWPQSVISFRRAC